MSEYCQIGDWIIWETPKGYYAGNDTFLSLRHDRNNCGGGVDYYDDGKEHHYFCWRCGAHVREIPLFLAKMIAIRAGRPLVRRGPGRII